MEVKGVKLCYCVPPDHEIGQSLLKARYDLLVVNATSKMGSCPTALGPASRHLPLRSVKKLKVAKITDMTEVVGLAAAKKVKAYFAEEERA